MPPLPTVRSASTAEPFAHHVGRTCHQGQNPKNHNRKAPACLPIFFLFCLPFVCPFACPFFFHDCKKAFVFNGYNHVFVCPFVCPFLPAQASRHTIAHNLKTRRETCSFLVVSLVGRRHACVSIHYATRLSAGRSLVVSLVACLLFVCYFACWSQTRLHFNQLWYKAFGTHFVCYFVCWSQLLSRRIPNLRDEYPALRQLWRTILPPAPNPVCSKQPLFCIVCRIYFYPYIYRTLPVFMTYFANLAAKPLFNT